MRITPKKGECRVPASICTQGDSPAAHAPCHCRLLLLAAHPPKNATCLPPTHPPPACPTTACLPAGKCILISGHDLQDTHDLLAQTEGTGLSVWTHGELLPAHGYPALKQRFPHLVGEGWQ